MVVWAAVQAGTAVVDVGMLVGMGRVLGREGRGNWRGWRGEEWVNLGITGGVLVVRVGFLVMVGLGGRGKKGKGKGD